MRIKEFLLIVSLAAISTQALAVTCGIGMDDSTCATPLRFPGCRVFDANGKFAYYQPNPALCASNGGDSSDTGQPQQNGTDGNTDGIGGGSAAGAPSADGPGGVGGGVGGTGAGSAGGNDGDGDGDGDG